MHGLIIKQRWLKLILSGHKVWELRRSRTGVRGKIALIASPSTSFRTGVIVGAAELVAVIGPMDFEQLRRHFRKHRIPPAELRAALERYGGAAHAWVLQNARPLPRPIPYRRKQGQVIWAIVPDVGGQRSKG